MDACWFALFIIPRHRPLISPPLALPSTMARNQEKAQSTLYRFRQAQAAELGLAPQHTKRPRVVSHVNSLREAEKWRGEVLREISRKVSGLLCQDAYEVSC